MQLPSNLENQDLPMSHCTFRLRWSLNTMILLLVLFPVVSFSFTSSRHISWRHPLPWSSLYAIKGKDIVIPDSSSSLEISIPFILLKEKTEKQLEIHKQHDKDQITRKQSCNQSPMHVSNNLQDDIVSEDENSRETKSKDEQVESADDKENEESDDAISVRRKAVTKLLLSSDSETSKPSNSRLHKTTTSVGPKRIKGVSSARVSSTKTTQLASAVRRAANAAATSRQSVQEILNSPKKPPTEAMKTAADPGLNASPMGFSTDDDNNSMHHPLLQNPKPGTLLIPQPSYDSKDNNSLSNILVRVATCADDVDVANLRLSVFSDFTPELRRLYGARSRQVLSNRRRRGATCLVATTAKATPSLQLLEKSNHGIILGSVECSVHELYGTLLGKRRIANSVLYITEVAVNSRYRRFGIGTKLMEGIDVLATRYRDVESLYLHVDVKNEAALRLYEKCGYVRVDQTNEMYREFTRTLNLHDGATRGRNHYLLVKHLKQVTWLAEEEQEDLTLRHEESAEIGKITQPMGFDISAT